MMDLLLSIAIGPVTSSPGIHIPRLTEPTAPIFFGDSIAPQTNQRFPSEEAWLKFVRTVDLFAFFYDREVGLMRVRPCATILTTDHLATVTRARLTYERAHPEALPGWGKVGGSPVTRDRNLALLLWLEWWIARALVLSPLPGFLYS